ncbi:MAG: sugar transferase [Magnetococcales bacterium]|nr:sugar transferase [Magnetococcales bacterium]
MKRLMDILLALIGLLLSAPVVLVFMLLVWRQDGHSPFYRGERIGLQGRVFRMTKLRTMIHNAHQSGVDSTSTSDRRITPVGERIRRFKLDELTQLWHVLIGEMSLVGPRPNVAADVALYTNRERDLLSVLPGITDLASIVFADEGDILRHSQDPDLDYNRLIRPWKSRLGLLYVQNRSTWLDIQIIWLTIRALINRPSALNRLARCVRRLGGSESLCQVVCRVDPLTPHPPPGSDVIVTSRRIND